MIQFTFLIKYGLNKLHNFFQRVSTHMPQNENKNKLDTKELDKILNKILNRVLLYCEQMSENDLLTCLDSHSELGYFLDDWYLGDTPEERQKNSIILTNEMAFFYIENRYFKSWEKLFHEKKEELGYDEDDEWDEW